jgi:protein ImuB
VGPTPNVARQGARWGSGIEIVEEPGAFIAALPVNALEPSPETTAILRRWGIQTVGELLGLGQEALTARLGLEALALFAAASSQASRPLQCVQPAERFEDAFEFEPEVETLEPLLFILRRFVDQLSLRLEPRGLIAEAMVLQLTLEAGEKVTTRLRLPQPTRRPDVLFRTLQTYLETVRTESPVKAVSLAVVPTRDEQKQLGLFETIISDPHRFQETLARLAAVLGPDRVGTPALENTHRPDAFHLSPPDFENAPVPEESRAAQVLPTTPIRRFRPAVKAEVECETIPGEQPARSAPPRPVSVRCGVVKGRLKITVGPWRASGNWWEPEAWEREEWDAATSDGQVIRLVHQPDGWFVEGVVD